MFAVIILLYVLYLASFFYLAKRFIFVFKIASPLCPYIYAMCAVLSIFSVISFIGRRAEHSLVSYIAPLSFIVMGVWAITISFSIINEILNTLNIFVKIKNFRYYSTLITMCVSIAASFWALANSAFILNIRPVSINTPDLPVETLKIVQLSDIHINGNTNPESIRALFKSASAQNADIIVLTGDIIDVDILADGRFSRYGFDELTAKYGVFAVTGNHDHYTGKEIFYGLCEKLNIHTLKNSAYLIGGVINIAGIEDTAHNNPALISGAFAAADSRYPVLFLSHRPEPFNTAAESGGAPSSGVIQLSGHTHAGQIPPVEIARRFFMKYNYGLYRQNGAVMYVSSGARYWGPPMRLGNTAEIAVITLSRR
ncbi:MAG: metallophosphoesterase [Spirochaetaceae bacterium]|jgi:predicted MPP superfamily phosphohydrolase|nr:metallophosphoesterase [Spirochaetaceae bacterium]